MTLGAWQAQGQKLLDPTITLFSSSFSHILSNIQISCTKLYTYAIKLYEWLIMVRSFKVSILALDTLSQVVPQAIPRSWKNGRGIIFTGGATWWGQSWIFTKKMIKSRFESAPLNHYMSYIILKKHHILGNLFN